MRTGQRKTAWIGMGFVLALGLAALGSAVAHARPHPAAAAVAKGKLEASIFSYDGQDFVRTETTLRTEKGKLAVNTKLDHESAAFKALSQKHSYEGDATVFGRHYDAKYAPLISEDGRLTGALFVATAK